MGGSEQNEELLSEKMKQLLDEQKGLRAQVKQAAIDMDYDTRCACDGEHDDVHDAAVQIGDELEADADVYIGKENEAADIVKSVEDAQTQDEKMQVVIAELQRMQGEMAKMQAHNKELSQTLTETENELRRSNNMGMFQAMGNSVKHLYHGVADAAHKGLEITAKTAKNVAKHAHDFHEKFQYSKDIAALNFKAASYQEMIDDYKESIQAYKEDCNRYSIKSTERAEKLAGKNEKATEKATKRLQIKEAFKNVFRVARGREQVDVSTIEAPAAQAKAPITRAAKSIDDFFTASMEETIKKLEEKQAHYEQAYEKVVGERKVLNDAYANRGLDSILKDATEQSAKEAGEVARDAREQENGLEK